MTTIGDLSWLSDEQRAELERDYWAPAATPYPVRRKFLVLYQDRPPGNWFVRTWTGRMLPCTRPNIVRAAAGWWRFAQGVARG